MNEEMKAVCSALMFMTMNIHRMEHDKSPGSPVAWWNCQKVRPCKTVAGRLVAAGYMDEEGVPVGS